VALFGNRLASPICLADATCFGLWTENTPPSQLDLASSHSSESIFLILKRCGVTPSCDVRSAVDTFFLFLFLPTQGPGLFCAPLHGLERMVKYMLSSGFAESRSRQAGAGLPGSAVERFAPPAVFPLPVRCRRGGAAGSYGYDLRTPTPEGAPAPSPAVLGGSLGPVSGRGWESLLRRTGLRCGNSLCFLGGGPLNI